MRARVRLLFMVASLLAASHAVAGGWYLKAFLGANDIDDVQFAIDTGVIDTSLDTGTMWGIAFGRQFKHFRLEGEIDTTRSNDVDRHRLNGAALAGSSGDIESEAGIINILFDFRREARIVPYVGVGVGVAEVELNDFGVNAIPDVVSDEDNLLAYQLLGGVGVPLNDRWILDFDVRYYWTDDAEISTSPTTGALQNEVEYEAVGVTAGFRYDF